jgi:hypothetical protein
MVVLAGTKLATVALYKDCAEAVGAVGNGLLVIPQLLFLHFHLALRAVSSSC